MAIVVVCRMNRKKKTCDRGDGVKTYTIEPMEVTVSIKAAKVVNVWSFIHLISLGIRV